MKTSGLSSLRTGSPRASVSGRAADDAVDQFLLVDLELDHGVELQALVGEHPVEGFGLGDGARESRRG